MVAWVGLGQAGNHAQQIMDAAVSEHAVISELQHELRHAEVEVNLLGTADEPAPRSELTQITRLLEHDFARARRFYKGTELETAKRAEKSWRAAETVLTTSLTTKSDRLDTASQDLFHHQIDAATSQLHDLDATRAGELTHDVAAYTNELHRNQRALVVAVVVAGMVTAFVARRLRLAASRPLRELESSLERVGANGLRERVEITGDREFHAVADALNEMSDRLRDTVEQLERQAFHDSLTGLPNRARLEARLSTVLADPAFGTVGVVILDLDEFKAINDGLGHPAGDEVLVAVGDLLRHALRPDDMIGRLGGDEFAVVLTHSSADDIGAISKRLTAAFDQPIVAARRSLLIAASAGAALARPGETPADLFRHADIALYSAKESGRARLHLFEPRMLDAVQQRLATETELRAAVKVGQIEVHYQPTLCMRTGRAVGVEALARWNHPTRGLLAPVAFISLAEETGLIVPLGRIVLGHACAQMAAWHANAQLEHLSLSVNVSARQLLAPDIVDQIRAALDDAGLSPRSLILEVTESITADTSAVTTLRELRNLGIRIALDDFGTGYSSLSYLHRLPIDVIKLDKGFIDDIHTHADRAALAKAIIRLGRSFGLETVAEGVEKPEQFQMLTQLGCDVAQGFLIARPAPAGATEATLLGLSGAEPVPTSPPSTSEDTTVTISIGPVAATSAVAWLAYATEVLDRIRASTPGTYAVPPGVFAAISAYAAMWTESVTTSETFVWTGQEDSNVLRAIAHHWFALAQQLTQEDLAVGQTDAPAAGEPFYDALISGMLVALTVGADSALEGEAIALQRSWPKTPPPQSEGIPALA